MCRNSIAFLAAGDTIDTKRYGFLSALPWEINGKCDNNKNIVYFFRFSYRLGACVCLLGLLTHGALFFMVIKRVAMVNKQ